MGKQIADAEPNFVICNLGPDICKVGTVLVPFDIHQKLSSELSDFSNDTFARGEKVIRVGSKILGTIGNLGKGIISGTSGPSGHAVVETGQGDVFVNGHKTARHYDLATMNTNA